MNIHKGDTIQIRSGKDRGKTGRVLKIDTKSGTALIEGLNMFKKHARPKRQGEKGEVVTLPRPLDISKVMLYCSNCKRGVRAGVREESSNKKTRYCKKCQISL